MVGHHSQGRLSGKIRTAGGELIQWNGDGLRRLLSPARVQRAVEEEHVHFRNGLFTPLVTLWTFLNQVLSPDGSCREAVANLLAFLAVQTHFPAATPNRFDPDTGPYCKARARLPEGLVSRLAKEMGRELHDRYPAGRLLGGRRVKIVDGTTVSMPDTPENQKAWPQPNTQKRGLGFPLTRLVVVMSMNCAAVLALAIGPYAGKRSGESTLFRTLLDSFEKGDVALADRYYASYWIISLLVARGVDSLFRQYQSRRVDFRVGRRLGRDDHVIQMIKPTQRPDWMDKAMYQQLPGELTVRETRVRVCQRGFRVKMLVLVTTLLDAQLYSKQELAETFRLRWHVELDLRTIKRTMKMDVLRCKTPEMVRKEIWMHLLAYNLIRTLMAEAARRECVEPRQISFAGTLQAVNAFAPAMELADEKDLPRLTEILLRIIACNRVGARPDRYEPRAVKRRPHPIALLMVPRKRAKRRLAKCGTAKC
jgi:hypothetical protein